jgi:putative hemolysin
MKHLKYILLLSMFSLSGCAAVFTDASDANHVTYVNSDGESIASLTKKASAYCAQYGKTASFKKSDTELVAVFDCNWPQASPR